MSEHTDETLERDLRDLAQALLDHPEFGPIIRDAGTHRNFEGDEALKIFEFCHTAPLFARYDRTKSSQIDAIYENPWVAIAVARRVAQGDFADVDDPAARKMISEQKALIPKDFLDNSFTRRKIAHSDFIPLFLEFSKSPGLHEAYDAALPIFEENGGWSNFDLGEVNRALTPIQAAALKVMRRYGFTQSTVPMWSLWCRMKEDGLNPLNEAEVRQLVSRLKISFIDMGA